MNERKTNDAEVQRIVRTFPYYTSSSEASIRRDTREWSSADFLYSLERLDSDVSSQNKEMHEGLRALYRTLLQEREDSEARNVLEEANVKRYAEISRRLEELKKPHWSIVPNLWLTFGILILALFGLIVSIVAVYRQH